LAGAIGTVIMFAVSLAVGRVLLRPGRLAVAAAREKRCQEPFVRSTRRAVPAKGS
jgi:membrane-bound lytic murein transglycosylase